MECLSHSQCTALLIGVVDSMFDWLIHFERSVDWMTDWFTDWVIHWKYGGLNDSVILVHCFIDWHIWLFIDPIDWFTDRFTNKISPCSRSCKFHRSNLILVIDWFSPLLFKAAFPKSIIYLANREYWCQLYYNVISLTMFLGNIFQVLSIDWLIHKTG